MRYAYYPGCSLESTAQEYDTSMRASFERLGIELIELDDWNCCGASPAAYVDPLLAYALPARDLARAESLGLTMTAPCSACYKNMLKTHHAAREDAALLAEINDVLGDGLEYRAESRVKHPLEVVVFDYGLEALKEQVSRPLTGLKVAPYYGCLLTRPHSEFDNVEDPTSMERLIEALGAEAVDYFPYKTKCCGGGLVLSDEGVALGLTHKLLTKAQAAGADCIMVACPLCDMLLDAYQPRVESKFGVKLGVPVLYFSQLMGLALGVDESRLGLDKRIVSPARALAAIGGGG